MTDTPRPELLWADLGLIRFPDADFLQSELAERRSGLDADFLLLAEHPPAYTYGARAQHTGALWPEAFLKERNIERFLTSRGGDPLYHAPGQIVGYTIFDTNVHELSPRSFVALIERALMLVLKDLGVRVFTSAKNPGLWVDEKQIATFGVHLSKGISRYGFTLNVTPDLEPARSAPAATDPVTSLKELGIEATAKDLIPRIAAAFGVVFHQQVHRIEAADLRQKIEA